MNKKRFINVIFSSLLLLFAGCSEEDLRFSDSENNRHDLDRVLIDLTHSQGVIPTSSEHKFFFDGDGENDLGQCAIVKSRVSSSKPLAITYDFGYGNETLVDAFAFFPVCDGYADSRRNPKKFSLYGTLDNPSSSNARWTMIGSEITFEGMTCPFEKKNGKAPWVRYVFGVKNSTAYRAYKFNITANNGDKDYVALQEIQLYRINTLIIGDNINGTGKLSPKRGPVNISSGEKMTLSASDVMVNESTKRTVVGYDTYKISFFGGYYHAGFTEGSSINYNHDGNAKYIEWQYETAYKVDVETNSRDKSLVEGSGWYKVGDKVHFVSHDSDKYEFVSWEVNGEVVSYAHSYDMPVTKATSVYANYLRKEQVLRPLYVSPYGNDSSDGLSASNAKKTIGAAIAILDEQMDVESRQGTVYVLPGEYDINDTLYVTNAISVIGLGKTSADTVIKQTSGKDRCVVLDHKYAVLDNLTFSNGVTDKCGGGVHIGNVEEYKAAFDYDGGVVTNCIFNSCSAYGESGHAGGVCIESNHGVVSHSLFENTSIHNGLTGKEVEDKSVVATVKNGGVLKNCLIKNSTDIEDQKIDYKNVNDNYLVMVTDNSKMVNCTVVKSSINKNTALYVDDTSKVVNCAVAECYAKQPDGDDNEENDVIVLSAVAGNYDNYINCVTDSINYKQGSMSVNDTCYIESAENMFVDKDKNFAPKRLSVLVNNGTTEDVDVSNVDMDGCYNEDTSTIDIGCFYQHVEPPTYIVVI